MIFSSHSSKSHISIDPAATTALWDKEDIAKFIATTARLAKNLRKDDWTYLCQHPEIRAIIRVITTETVNAKPDNIYTFIANIFSSSNKNNLIPMINQQLEWVNEQLRKGAWDPADGEMFFTESESSGREFGKKKDCGDNEGEDKNKDRENGEQTNVCPENFQPNCN